MAPSNATQSPEEKYSPSPPRLPKLSQHVASRRFTGASILPRLTYPHSVVCHSPFASFARRVLVSGISLRWGQVLPQCGMGAGPHEECPPRKPASSRDDVRILLHLHGELDTPILAIVICTFPCAALGYSFGSSLESWCFTLHFSNLKGPH